MTGTFNRRMAILRKNLFTYSGLMFNFVMKAMYYGGVPLSILYGKYLFAF